MDSNEWNFWGVTEEKISSPVGKRQRNKDNTYRFNLHFPNDSWYWNYIHVLICYVLIICLYLFCPYMNSLLKMKFARIFFQSFTFFFFSYLAYLESIIIQFWWSPIYQCLLVWIMHVMSHFKNSLLSSRFWGISSMYFFLKIIVLHLKLWSILN